MLSFVCRSVFVCQFTWSLSDLHASTGASSRVDPNRMRVSTLPEFGATTPTAVGWCDVADELLCDPLVRTHSQTCSTRSFPAVVSGVRLVSGATASGSERGAGLGGVREQRTERSHAELTTRQRKERATSNLETKKNKQTNKQTNGRKVGRVEGLDV